MNLVLVDLDGVVIDVDKRLGVATRARDEFIQAADIPDQDLEKLAVNHYWRVFFTPELLELDTLIPDAEQRVYKLLDENIVALYSSRPEELRVATQRWLELHVLGWAIPLLPLILKPAPFMFTKTANWKQGMAETLLYFSGAKRLIMIDDSPENFPTHFPLTCYISLENWENGIPYDAGVLKQ